MGSPAIFKGNKTKLLTSGGLIVNNITEDTLNAGVTIEGVLLIDGTIDGRDLGQDGTDLDNHIASTSNPHSVTATQVGLGNVTNDAQLKRAAGDFDTFTNKSNPVGADILLIEDSADSFNKKKIAVSTLAFSPSVNSVTLSSSGQITLANSPTQIWVVSGLFPGETTLNPFAFGNSAPSINGMEVTLIGGSATNLIRINYADAANGVILNGSSITLGQYDSVTFVYVSSLARFVEKTRS